MKKICHLFVALLLFSTGTFAQTIQVSWDKTTVLIFNSPIQSVDRGNRFLLSELDSKALNLLKLKAGSKELPETNLHVVTEDGEVHSFEVHYAQDPAETTLDLRKNQDGKEALSKYDLNQSEFDQLAENLHSTRDGWIKKQFRYEVHFWLREIYIQDGLLFFDLAAKNMSSIPFDVMGPEAKVVDTRSKNQSSGREQRLLPYLDLTGQSQTLGAGEDLSLLIAFPVFTISNQKRLLFYLKEKNGDRELQLVLKGKKILEAIPLPMFHTKPTIAYGSGKF